FFQAEDGIRDDLVTGVQTCALPILCTNIAMTAPIAGSGKGGAGWFPVSQAVVGYDHPSHAPFDHALLLDFSNPALGVGARVAVRSEERRVGKEGSGWWGRCTGRQKW